MPTASSSTPAAWSSSGRPSPTTPSRTREAIESRFHVPAISVTGTDDWLGEWTFCLPQGSMTDEPIFWAQLLAKAGTPRRAASSSSRLSASPTSGTSGRPARRRGIRIVAEEWIAQTAQDVAGASVKLREAKPRRVVHCGFGFGVVQVNPGSSRPGWDPPRYMGTAFQNAWINEVMWNSMLGWVGVDQYDPGNPVGQDASWTVRGRAMTPTRILRPRRESRPGHRPRSMPSPTRIR